jgi:hypothetical protein
MAQPEQCLGAGQRQWIIDNTLVGVVNPEGFENQLRLALCLPLLRRPGLLYDYSQVEFGLTNYLGPVYDQIGLYASVDPLSFLQLRADVQGVVYWPFHFTDGAGYFGEHGYTRAYADPALPERNAEAALGLVVTLTLVLRGSVELHPRLGLLLTNSLAGEYWQLGHAPYYVNLRRDVVLARNDWLLKNTALVAFEVHARKGPGVRVDVRLGVTDDLTEVPASGQLVNIVGGWLSVLVRRAGRLRDIEPFVRVGGYTHHPFRTDTAVVPYAPLQLFGGLSLAFAWPASPESEPPSEH